MTMFIVDAAVGAIHPNIALRRNSRVSPAGFQSSSTMMPSDATVATAESTIGNGSVSDTRRRLAKYRGGGKDDPSIASGDSHHSSMRKKAEELKASLKSFKSLTNKSLSGSSSGGKRNKKKSTSSILRKSRRSSVDTVSTVVDDMMDGPSNHSSSAPRVTFDLSKLQASHEKEVSNLRQQSATLQTQLVSTTQRLEDADSRAAKKMTGMQSELNRTRKARSMSLDLHAKESKDQAVCIKTLGKKLIKQAHMIKKQKLEMNEYEIRMSGLQEEINMQDERDFQKDEAMTDLQTEYDTLTEQKRDLQRTLQENVEEMMDMRTERENAASRIEELETDLAQKHKDLEEARRESHERAERITFLESRLEEKTEECEVLGVQLKASQKAVKCMKTELTRSSNEIEEMRRKMETMDEEASDRAKAVATRGTYGRRATFLGFCNGEGSRRSFGGGGNGDHQNDPQDDIRERDQQIQSLNQTIQANDTDMKKIKSDMVKVSSMYKQDDYLQRTQINKLKRSEAELALKLRGMENAFRRLTSAQGEAYIGGGCHSKDLNTMKGVMEAVEKRLEVIPSPLCSQ